MAGLRRRRICMKRPGNSILRLRLLNTLVCKKILTCLSLEEKVQKMFQFSWTLKCRVAWSGFVSVGSVYLLCLGSWFGSGDFLHRFGSGSGIFKGSPKVEKVSTILTSLKRTKKMQYTSARVMAKSAGSKIPILHLHYKYTLTTLWAVA
jgi:hypothetical protein